MFQYKMLEDTGKISRGRATLPFDDVTPAIRYLERQGGVVLSIRPLDAFSTLVAKISQSLRKVKRKQLAEVLNNLSLLLAAGVPVLTAINDVRHDQRNPMLIQVLRFIRVDIENGQTLSQAMSRHPGVFSPLIISMCRIGEETGRLDSMLRKSAQHLLHFDEIIGATKRALLYPAFLFAMTIGITVFWFIWVVPQLVQLFHQMNVELPLVTRALITASDLVQAYFMHFFLACLGVLIILPILRTRSSRVRRGMDWTLLRIPVIKQVIELSLVARISEYLGSLMAAGIGVVRTLDIIIGSLNNTIFRERFLAVQDSLRNGLNLSSSLRQSNALPPFAVRMITVGEEAGKIDEQTLFVAKIYRERLNSLVEVLGKSLEPAMLIFLGGIFALIIVGLLWPIYDLLTVIL